MTNVSFHRENTHPYPVEKNTYVPFRSTIGGRFRPISSAATNSGGLINTATVNFGLGCPFGLDAKFREGVAQKVVLLNNWR